MVLYFTGTGNSRYAASIISQICGDELISINSIMRQRTEDPYIAKYSFESEKPFVIVCPTHCWNIPRAVQQFLKDSRFIGSNKMYFFLTCGSSTGAAAEHAQALCAELGMNFMGLSSAVMPENYIAMFKTPSYDEALGIIRASVSKIESSARLINMEKAILDTNKGNIFLSKINPVFYRIFVKDKAFHTTENCNSCGLCEKICPAMNISIDDKGLPRWKGNCIHCMACINSCPQQAIEYGKISVGKRRYLLMPDGNQKR